MKMRSLTILVAMLVFCCGLSLASCTHRQYAMPIIELPPEPQKPSIKSSVIVQNSIPYIGYTVPEALKLYEYLLKKDAFEEKLIFRLQSMNELWKGR